MPIAIPFYCMLLPLFCTIATIVATIKRFNHK